MRPLVAPEPQYLAGANGNGPSGTGTRSKGIHWGPSYRGGDGGGKEIPSSDFFRTTLASEKSRHAHPFMRHSSPKVIASILHSDLGLNLSINES